MFELPYYYFFLFIYLFLFSYFFLFFFFFGGGGGGGSDILIFLEIRRFCGYFGGSRQNWTSFRCLFYVF